MPRVLLLAFAALACPLTGCLSVHATRPVDIVVTRADTGEPAAGVPVSAYYLMRMLDFRLNRPSGCEGVTDADGRLTLMLSDSDHGPAIGVGGAHFYTTPAAVRNGSPSLEGVTIGHPVLREVLADGSIVGPAPDSPPRKVQPPAYAVRLAPRRRWMLEHWLLPRGEAFGTPVPGE